MSKLASLLGGMTLNDLAREILGSQGRGGDTELAHVNKREAALLKSQGGSGTVNPQTGMTEFQDSFEVDPFGGYPDTSTYGGDVEAQQGGFYGETPTAKIFSQGPESTTVALSPYGERAIPAFVTSAPGQDVSYEAIPGRSADVEAQMGGYYGGRPPTAEEYANIYGQPTPSVAGGQITPAPQEISGKEPGLLDRAEKLAKQYPGTTRALTAAALGAPGMMAGARARREAARTRAEMEQMAAPIRQTGEQLLGAGQRGELTAPQQQQIQAARAAARQSLAQRGVTSGTAAQQAENRITELAQRFAQQNIDNGVRLIGAANSYNAAAIQQAYRMNADANTMTQNYFTNLMRAFGALPTTQTTTTRTE